MKIEFFVSSGANIDSTKSRVMSLRELGMSEHDWRNLTDDEKLEEVKNWTLDQIEYWWEEKD